MTDPATDLPAATRTSRHVAGLPQLDCFALGEDWAHAKALEQHWQLLAESMGRPPAAWSDSTGERVYAAVIWLAFRDDPAQPLAEDDGFSATTTLEAIRKPYALSTTRFDWGRGAGAEVRLLTGFVRRSQRGQNKKFATVRDIWTDPDRNPDLVEALLDRHHAAKAGPLPEAVARRHQVSRLADFNAAGLFYFRNFVRLARAAEWAAETAAGGPALRPTAREAFFYGNADDGQTLEARVALGAAGRGCAVLSDDGRCLFRSLSQGSMAAPPP